MTTDAKVESFAVRQRRASRGEECNEQTKFARMMEKYLDRNCIFWSALENKPLSRLSGMFQKRRGVRSGLPDVYVLYLGKSIFVELKSRRGVASKAQRQLRLEMLPAGAVWWMALKAWEGPFPDPTQRLPQEPRVAAERAAARKRWRERQRACKAAKLAAERDDAAKHEIASR